jgi:hypothetical protein
LQQENELAQKVCHLTKRPDESRHGRTVVRELINYLKKHEECKATNREL